MPSADSRPTVRMNRVTLSHDSVTCGGSPEVSSTAFRAQPPDLPSLCLLEMGFAVICQLAPHRRPLYPVFVHRLAPLIHASFRPRLATTPLRFSSPSPPPGWAGDFHPLAVEHVRHTIKKPFRFPRNGSGSPQGGRGLKQKHYLGCEASAGSAAMGVAGALFCAAAGDSVVLVISRTSTVRLSWRPEAEPLEADGLSLPNQTMYDL